MDPTTMDLDQIRDWAARRPEHGGWTQHPYTTPRIGDGPPHPERLRWFSYGCIYVGGDDDHPIPATLDAIAGLMPSGWRWTRRLDADTELVWIATNVTLGKSALVSDTGNELLDRARLAMLATLAEDRNKEKAQ